MHETTITAQYVNLPDKYPEWGSVKTTEGTRYSVPKGMVSLFQAGQSYLVGYTTNDKGYHTIKEVKTPSTIRAQSVPNGAERGSLVKIAVDLVTRGQWNEDEIYGMIKTGQRIADRVLAVKELEDKSDGWPGP